jgi:anti-sigma factor RsiW
MRKNMEHPDRELLIALADGILTPERKIEVRSHMDHCPTCASILEQEAALSRTLRMQRLVQPSPAFDRAVLDAVLPRSAARVAQEASFRKYAGVFVLCIFTIIVFLISSGSGSNSPSWMHPVHDAVNGSTRWMTESFVEGSSALFAPLTRATAHGGVLDIFCMATFALLLLGGIDRIIAPLLKKGR